VTRDIIIIIIIIIIINWSHWNSNEKLKEKFGSRTKKTFDSSLQKTAILGTSHIIRKVLQCEA
jgi:FtsZ-interacting cell division protein ZipA